MTKVAEKSHRGGSKPGERRGGRKKGTPNKKTAAVVEAVKAGGVMPLDYMLGVMRDPISNDTDPSVKVAMVGLRFEAAKAAAPYVHPKLSAIEHTGKDGTPLVPAQMDEMEQIRRLYFMLAKGAAAVERTDNPGPKPTKKKITLPG